MKYRTRVQLFFQQFKVRYQRAEKFGLQQTLGLIRTTVRRSMRERKGASQPGKPPHAHRRAGLKEINFDVQGSSGIVGPRKFRASRFFNRPVPNIHEKGGIAIGRTVRNRKPYNYPERSFMWAAVKKLQSRGKISREFNISMRRVL